MNRKKLATKVYQHPLVRKASSLDEINQTQINKIIVEEVMQEEPRPSYKSAIGTPYRTLKQIKAQPAGPERNAKLQNYIKGYEEGGTSHYRHFDALSDEDQKKYQVYVAKKIAVAKELIQAATECEPTPDEPNKCKEAEAETLKADAELDKALGPESPAADTGGGNIASAVTNAVSILNSSIGYITIAAVIVPGAQVALPVLKGLQIPLATAASILQLAANDDVPAAVTELVQVLPVDKIPGFDKLASKVAGPILAAMGKELTEAGVKEVTENILQDAIGKTIIALDEYGIKLGDEEYHLKDLATLSAPEAIRTLTTSAGDIGTQLLGLLKNLVPGLGGEDPAADVDPRLAKFQESEFYTGLESDDLKAGFEYVFKYFIDNAVISESLKDVVLKLGIKPADMRKALMALKEENDPAFKAVVAFLKEEQNVSAFVQAMKEFGLGVDSTPEPEEEPAPGEEPTPGEEPEIDADPADLDDFQEAYAVWMNPSEGFMSVRLLIQQSKVFEAMWHPVKRLSGKSTDPLDQQERSITDFTADQEEEVEAGTPLAEEEDTAPPTDAPPAEPEAEPEPEAEEPPAPEGEIAPEEKQEFKRDILEGLIVAQRHAKQVDQVLGIYKRFTGKLTRGSVEAFKKFGESNPKELLYKLVNLLIKDINLMLETIETIESEREKISEVLLEIEGEKFSDKLRKVKAAHEVVKTQGQIILEMVGRSDGPPSPAPEPTPPVEEPAPAEEPAEEVPADEPPEDTEPEVLEEAVYQATLRELEGEGDTEPQSQALSVKEQALTIYEAMATVKEYFPTANPLASEHSFEKVIGTFQQLLGRFKKHIAAMSRFKDDRQINQSTLRSAKEELISIKKIMMDLFGVGEDGRRQTAGDSEGAYSDTGEEGIRTGELEEPTTSGDAAEEDEPMEAGKPKNIGSVANLELFMTKSQFLFDSTISATLRKFPEEQQTNVLRFLSYFVGYFAPAKPTAYDPAPLQESEQALITTFSKYVSGYLGGEKDAYDNMKKFLVVLKRVDEPLVDAITNMISGGQRMRLVMLLQKTADRLQELKPYGSYDTAGRLALIKGIEITAPGSVDDGGDDEGTAPDTALDDLVGPFVSDEIDRINTELEAENPDATEEEVDAEVASEVEQNEEEVVNAVVEEIPEDDLPADVSREDLFKAVQDELDRVIQGAASWEDFDGAHRPNFEDLELTDFEPLMKTEMYKVFMSGNLPLNVKSPEDFNKWKEALGLLNEGTLDLYDGPAEFKQENEEYLQDIVKMMKWLKEGLQQEPDQMLSEVELSIKALHTFFKAITDAVKERDTAQAQTAVSDFIEDTKDHPAFEGENIPKIEMPPPPGQDAEEERPGIKMPPVPEEISKSALNRTMKGLKSKAPGRFDVGKATQVVKDILQTRNIALKEGIGRGILTMRDLEAALVEAGAIDADEHSTATTKLLVTALEKLGISFDDLPASAGDGETEAEPEVEKIAKELEPAVRKIAKKKLKLGSKKGKKLSKKDVVEDAIEDVVATPPPGVEEELEALTDETQAAVEDELAKMVSGEDDSPSSDTEGRIDTSGLNEKEKKLAKAYELMMSYVTDDEDALYSIEANAEAVTEGEYEFEDNLSPEDQFKKSKDQINTLLIQGSLDAMIKGLTFNKDSVPDREEVNQKLKPISDILEDLFAFRIAPVRLGEKFDSQNEEAVGSEDYGEEYDGRIVGYKSAGLEIDGRLARGPRVMVGR